MDLLNITMEEGFQHSGAIGHSSLNNSGEEEWDSRIKRHLTTYNDWVKEEEKNLSKVKDWILELQTFVDSNRNVHVPIKKAISELTKHVSVLSEVVTFKEKTVTTILREAKGAIRRGRDGSSLLVDFTDKPTQDKVNVPCADKGTQVDMVPGVYKSKRKRDSPGKGSDKDPKKPNSGLNAPTICIDLAPDPQGEPFERTPGVD